MAKYRRQIENGTTLISVDKIPQEQVIALLKEKCELKRQRLALVEQKQKLNKDIYNYSTRINQLEEIIDKQIIKYFGG